MWYVLELYAYPSFHNLDMAALSIILRIMFCGALKSMQIDLKIIDSV